jgi:CyaY protein
VQRALLATTGKQAQQQRCTHGACRGKSHRYTQPFFLHAQILSTMTAQTMPTPLSDAEYHTRTNAILESVERWVDQWLQDDLIDIDANRTGGLLELSFPNGSKLILNTQPPLHELWLAAQSGGFHYKFVDGHWRDTRDGTEFFDALSAGASAQAGQALRFNAPG